MPKFKKNPNPIRKNFGVGVTENPDATSPSSSGFKMKYKHSAFPFKESPMKLEESNYAPFDPNTPAATDHHHTQETGSTETTYARTEGEEKMRRSFERVYGTLDNPSTAAANVLNAPGQAGENLRQSYIDYGLENDQGYDAWSTSRTERWAKGRRSV